MKTKQFLFGALPESNSPAGTLNALDLQKTGRLLAVVVAGAAATAALDFITKFLTGADLGPYGPMLMPVISGFLELGRRYIAQHFPPQE